MPHDCGWRCGEFTWQRRHPRDENGKITRFPIADGEDFDREDPQIHCSFCGSMTPEAMMKRMRAGEKIGPTDKPYKIYVGSSGMDAFYMNHMTSAELSREFYDAYTSKRMNVGYPGHFYAHIWLPAMPKPA